MATPRRAVASWACRCLTSRLIPCSVTPCTAYHAAKLLSRANQLLLNSAPPAGDGRGRNPARGGRLQAPPRGRSPRRRHHRRRPSEGLQRQARHQSRAREPPPKAASHRWERALGARPGASHAARLRALHGRCCPYRAAGEPCEPFKGRSGASCAAPRTAAQRELRSSLPPSPAAGELCEPLGALQARRSCERPLHSGASSRRRLGGS